MNAHLPTLLAKHSSTNVLIFPFITALALADSSLTRTAKESRTASCWSVWPIARSRSASRLSKLILHRRTTPSSPLLEKKPKIKKKIKKKRKKKKKNF
jgi:hypothetical protein